MVVAQIDCQLSGEVALKEAVRYVQSPHLRFLLADDLGYQSRVSFVLLVDERQIHSLGLIDHRRVDISSLALSINFQGLSGDASIDLLEFEVGVDNQQHVCIIQVVH